MIKTKLVVTHHTLCLSIYTGGSVSSDISFDAVSNLYFANGVRDRSLTIRILADDIPELTEVMTLIFT